MTSILRKIRLDLLYIEDFIAFDQFFYIDKHRKNTKIKKTTIARQHIKMTNWEDLKFGLVS